MYLKDGPRKYGRGWGARGTSEGQYKAREYASTVTAAQAHAETEPTEQHSADAVEIEREGETGKVMSTRKGFFTSSNYSLIFLHRPAPRMP